MGLQFTKDMVNKKYICHKFEKKASIFQKSLCPLDQLLLFPTNKFKSMISHLYILEANLLVYNDHFVMILAKKIVDAAKSIVATKSVRLLNNPLFIKNSKKGNGFSCRFASSLTMNFKSINPYGIRYNFSSFKDDFNQQAEDKDSILKKFQTFVINFQSSYDAGKYEQALQYLEQTAELMKKVNCQDSLQYVEIMLNIVATTKKCQKTERTISALEQAENILSKLSDENYTHKQIVYTHLSYEYDVKKDAAKTIHYLNKLLQLYQKTGIESFEVITINEKVGELLIELNKLEQAIPYFKQALKLLESKDSAKGNEYLKILDDLSYIYYNLNKFDEVLQLRLRALQIQETLSGKESLTYIAHLKNVGLIYKRLNNFDKYTKTLEEALTIASKINHEQAPIVNEIKQNLGVYYFHAKHQFEKAVPLLQNVLNLISLEKQEAKYLFLMRTVAECYKNMKEYDLSKQKYLSVLATLDKRQEKSCEYAYILSEVGLAYYNLENYEQSLDHYLRSLKIEEEKHGHASQACILLYENIAQLYYLLGNQPQSEAYLRKIDQYKSSATKSH